MRIPLEITFRNVEKSKSLENLIHEKAKKLSRFSDSIISCRVAVDQPNDHQKTGSGYRVRLTLGLPPGHEMVVRREAGEGDLHDTLPGIIREVFRVAQRRVGQLMEKQRGDTKAREAQEMSAVVDKLFPEEGYGFLRTLDGREVYFHRNSVLSEGYDLLEVGTGVHHIESLGNNGPQASAVQIMDGSAE